jgi:excisionase family DNA binding protein
MSGSPGYALVKMGLLTADEVATILRITPRHVRRLGAEGRITRVRLGARTTRYTAASVADLIDPASEDRHGGAGYGPR